MSSELITGKTSFVTFYSFKGGVGRSMAMINVAGMLAGRGFRVLALDMDLEAPGISYLLRDRNQPGQDSAPGFVDLLAQACAEGEKSDLFALPPTELVARYTHPYALPEELVKSSDGELRIMPAGRLDEAYQKRLDQLGLSKLYEAGLGQPLIQAFKRILCDARAFDFILVDSRTGFSDESGICTRDLADHLVVVMGLNHQNQEGTAAFLRSLPQPKEGSPKKGLRVVLSPVPVGEDELIDQREKQIKEVLERAFGNPIDVSLQIPYHPRLALTEEPHVFRRSRGNLYQAYKEIEDAVLGLLKLSARDLQLALQRAIHSEHYESIGSGFKLLSRIDSKSSAYFASKLPESIIYNPNAGSLLVILSENLSPETPEYTHLATKLSVANIELANRFFDELAYSGNFPEFLHGEYARHLHYVQQDYKNAELQYKMAINIFPLDAGTLGHYAVFAWQIKNNPGLAESLFQQALKINPGESSALSNYAVFLARFRLDYEAAERMFRQAIKSDPENPNFWANFSQLLFQRKQNDEARKCLLSALSLGPKSADVLSEIYFYAYAHAYPHYPGSLEKLKLLLLSGKGSEGWDFKKNVEVATAAGHPEPEFLAALAEVVSGRKHVSTLEDFAAWKAVEVPTVPAAAAPPSPSV